MTVKNEKVVKNLAARIENILGANGIDVLGQYELVSSGTVIATSNSIKIAYPRDLEESVTKVMVPDSGIEVVVNSQPYIMFSAYCNNAHASDRFYEIILTQHSKEGLTEAVEALLGSYYLDFPQNPICRGYVKRVDNSEGYYPPRAIMYHRYSSYIG